MRKKKEKREKTLGVKVIKHVTIPDGTVVVGGTTVKKIWQLKNLHKSLSWPEGTRLVLVRGNKEVGKKNECEVPKAGPEEIVEVSVVLSPPVKDTFYTLRYMLETPEGVRFGPRLGVNFAVSKEDTTDTECLESDHLPIAPVVDQYKSQKEQLRGMGFTQSNDFLHALLIEKKGNVQEVVFALFTLHN